MTDTFSQLPSFKEQLAVVFNDYMQTLGGGERLTLAYALALKTLGFTVEIVTRGEVPPPAKITGIFGPEFAAIPIRKIQFQNIRDYFKTSGLFVFVNNTFMDTSPNPAKVGVYSQMFPAHSIRYKEQPQETHNLNTYQIIACLSSFTEKYTRALWDVPQENIKTLFPPIGSDMSLLAEKLLKKPLKKEKILVTLGRFNPGGHNKNQKILIESFLKAQSRYPNLKDWQFWVIGNKNETPDSEQYFQDCLKLSQGTSVKIIEGMPHTDLTATLDRAFGYVHGTGAFWPPGVHPEFCEHYGLAILEGMAHGCIPLVYGRGGIFDIMAPFAGGIPYISAEGLSEGFGLLADLFESPDAGAMVQTNLNSLTQVSQQCFTQNLCRLITSCL